MFFIEGISIKNFRTLQNVYIGKHWGTDEEPLPELICCIGAPNTGKSEFWDVFSFIQDMNRNSVMDACIKRGGLNNIRIQDKSSPIEFEFVLSDHRNNEYLYKITLREDDFKNTCRDDLVQVRTYRDTEVYKLDDINRFFTKLFTPAFTDQGLRNSFDYSASGSLVEDGSNFVSVMADAAENKDNEFWFQQRIASMLRASGYHAIAKPAFDIAGNMARHQIFALHEQNYAGDPEDNREQYSTNTLRYIAYMVLACTLNRYHFVRIQGLENGLYFTLQEYLAEAMLSAAKCNRRTVLLFTYSPQVLNMLDDKNVFVFYKNQLDQTEIVQASRVPLIHNMMQEGFQMGYLWTSDYLMPDRNGSFSENETKE